MIREERLLKVLRAPHVSEKASTAMEKSNTIVLKVAKDVTKAEIKAAVQKLKDMALEDVLIITGELDENLFLAARNLYKVDVRDASGIDPVSLIAFDKVVMTADAVKQVEEMLA